MTLILPTASSNSFRSRSESRTYDSASDVAFRNAALCVISSPTGGLACFARGLAASFFFDDAALDDGLRFFMLVNETPRRNESMTGSLWQDIRTVSSAPRLYLFIPSCCKVPEGRRNKAGVKRKRNSGHEHSEENRSPAKGDGTTDIWPGGIEPFNPRGRHPCRGFVPVAFAKPEASLCCAPGSIPPCLRLLSHSLPNLDRPPTINH